MNNSDDNGKISIERIILTNFRQHESLEVTFKDLNVIVGSNGAGKTSILEAICYGLFGAVANGATKKELVKIGAKTGGVTIVFSNGYKVVRDFGTTIKLLDSNDRVISEKASQIESYLAIDKNVFLNILYAAQNEIYNYFIKFNAQQKDFFDDLFNLSDMTDTINTVLKDTSNSITNQYNLSIQLQNTRDTLSKHISDTLAALSVSSIEELQSILTGTYEMVQRYKNLYESYQKNQSLLSSLSTYNSNRDMILKNIDSIASRINDTQNAIDRSQEALSKYIEQISVSMKVSIDANNLNGFYEMLLAQANLSTHIDNIVRAVTVAQKDPSQTSTMLSYILQCANTIKQLDSYKNYYHQIIDTMKKLYNDIVNVTSRYTYDNNDLVRLRQQLSTIDSQIQQLKDTIGDMDQLSNMVSNDSKIGTAYIQQQSRYSMLDTSYKSLLSYREQIDKLSSSNGADDSSNTIGTLNNSDLQLLLNKIHDIIQVFGRNGFVSYLRKSLLKEIAVSIGDSLEKFGFTKLIPVDIDSKSGALTFHDRLFRSLSGGEKTIVSILLRVLYARLLAPATKINILMLDEPTADLDSIRVGYLRQMLFKISKMMNMQVIMVTHDESVIPDQANLIVINTQLR